MWDIQTFLGKINKNGEKANVRFELILWLGETNIVEDNIFL